MPWISKWASLQIRARRKQDAKLSKLSGRTTLDKDPCPDALLHRRPRWAVLDPLRFGAQHVIAFWTARRFPIFGVIRHRTLIAFGPEAVLFAALPSWRGFSVLRVHCQH